MLEMARSRIWPRCSSHHLKILGVRAALAARHVVPAQAHESLHAVLPRSALGKRAGTSERGQG